MNHYSEYDLTNEEADSYCAGSESQRVRDYIATRLSKSCNAVLDVGCGNGIDAERYAPAAYYGVDVSPALISAARRKHPKHHFEVMDARELTAEADTIILKAILEHAHSQQEALLILAQALKRSEKTYVAWHTPPRFRMSEPLIHQVPGHFGRTVYQNIYQQEAFNILLLGRNVETVQIDNYYLWVIS